MDCLYKIDETDYLVVTSMLGSEYDRNHVLRFYNGYYQYVLRFLGRTSLAPELMEQVRSYREVLAALTHAHNSDQYMIMCVQQLRPDSIKLFSDIVSVDYVVREQDVSTWDTLCALYKRFFGHFARKTYGDTRMYRLCVIDLTRTVSDAMYERSTSESSNSHTQHNYATYFAKKYKQYLRGDSHLGLCSPTFEVETQQFANWDDYQRKMAAFPRHRFYYIPLELLYVFEGEIPQPPELGGLCVFLDALFACQQPLRELGFSGASPYDLWRRFDSVQCVPLQHVQPRHRSIFYNAYSATSAEEAASYVLPCNSVCNTVLHTQLTEASFKLYYFAIAHRESTERQRMEFLGDALLGYLIAEKIAACGHKYMRHKARLASNDYMARVYAEHRGILEKIVPAHAQSEKPMADALECAFAFLYLTRGLEFCDAALARMIIIEDNIRAALASQQQRLSASVVQSMIESYQQQGSILQGTPFDISADDIELRAIWSAAAFVDEVPNCRCAVRIKTSMRYSVKYETLAFNLVTALNINQYITNANEYYLKWALLRVVSVTCEALEMLGDAFLKFSLSLSLYMLMPDANEGVMSILRRSLENNVNLRQILFYKIPFAALQTFEVKAYDLTSKRFADLCESLLGAVLLTVGPEGTATLIRQLVVVDNNILAGRHFELLNMLAAHNSVKVEALQYENSLATHFNGTPILRAGASSSVIYRMLCNYCTLDANARNTSALRAPY